MSKVLCFVVLLFALQGCASLTEGTTQVVYLTNLPESGCMVQGAYVNPHWNKVQVKKAKEALEIRCEGETKIVESKISSAGITSIFWYCRYLDWSHVEISRRD